MNRDDRDVPSPPPKAGKIVAPGRFIGPGMYVGPVRISFTATSMQTTNVSFSLIQRMWAQRAELERYERFAFGQFFYVTLMGHVEARLAEVIDRRVQSVVDFLEEAEKRAPDWNLRSGSTGEPFSCARAIVSTKALVDAFRKDVEEVLTFEKLCSEFHTLFGQKVNEVVDKEVSSDLNALRKMRNVFAHGRKLSFSFEQTEDNEVDWSSTQLKFPAERLLRAGLIASMDVTAEGTDQFFDALFSEAALLHFYGRVRKFDDAIRQFLVPVLDTRVPLSIRLPDLAATASLPPSPR